MTLRSLPLPPENYDQVLLGKVRFGDLAFNAIDEVWAAITKVDYDCLGADVVNYYGVARYAGSGKSMND